MEFNLSSVAGQWKIGEELCQARFSVKRPPNSHWHVSCSNGWRENLLDASLRESASSLKLGQQIC